MSGMFVCLEPGKEGGRGDKVFDVVVKSFVLRLRMRDFFFLLFARHHLLDRIIALGKGLWNRRRVACPIAANP